MITGIIQSTAFWVGAAITVGGLIAARYYWPAFVEWLDEEDPDIEDELDSIENEFGMSMDRFGYVQDARNAAGRQ